MTVKIQGITYQGDVSSYLYPFVSMGKVFVKCNIILIMNISQNNADFFVPGSTLYERGYCY